MASRNATFGRLFDDLTTFHEALSPDTGDDETQRRVRAYLAENEEAVRESFRIWARLGRKGRQALNDEHRQLDESAIDDGFLQVAENALEAGLDTGSMRAPVTDDDVNMIRRVVNYAAHAPDAGQSDV